MGSRGDGKKKNFLDAPGCLSEAVGVRRNNRMGKNPIPMVADREFKGSAAPLPGPEASPGPWPPDEHPVTDPLLPIGSPGAESRGGVGPADRILPGRHRSPGDPESLP